MVSIDLRHFSRDELRISREEAARVLKFFFPDQPIPAGNLTDEDIGFAQALLLEAIDRSNQMGYVRILFDKFEGKLPVDFSFIKDVASAFCKRAMSNWFNHATGKDLANPQIYTSVRNTIAVNFRSVWAIRLATGELTY